MKLRVGTLLSALVQILSIFVGIPLAVTFLPDVVLYLVVAAGSLIGAVVVGVWPDRAEWLWGRSPLANLLCSVSAGCMAAASMEKADTGGSSGSAWTLAGLIAILGWGFVVGVRRGRTRRQDAV